MSLGGFSGVSNIASPTSITLVQLDPFPDLPPSAAAAARLASFIKAVALVRTDIPFPGKWRADVAVTQTHSKERTVTSHPVENGFRITDSSRRLPTVLSFTGIISDTPITGVGLIVQAVTQAVLQSRALLAKEKLDRWYDDGEPLFVATSIGNYREMLIKKYSITRDSNSGQALEFNLVLQEIQIGSRTTVASLIDDDALNLGAGVGSNAGTQAAVPI